jgi:hypothetical protein
MRSPHGHGHGPAGLVVAAAAALRPHPRDPLGDQHRFLVRDALRKYASSTKSVSSSAGAGRWVRAEDCRGVQMPQAGLGQKWLAHSPSKRRSARAPAKVDARAAQLAAVRW